MHAAGEKLFNASPGVRLAVMACVCVVMIFFGYMFNNTYQIGQLNKAKTSETLLKQTVLAKQAQLSQLKQTAVHVQTMLATFNKMISELPPGSNIDDILRDISKLGAEQGLTFVYFRPQEEKKIIFYAEIPIEVTVLGQYHALANFISNIAHLKQLVTVHDFTIRRENPKKDTLTMRMTLNIYRQLSPEDQKAMQAAAKQGAKK